MKKKNKRNLREFYHYLLGTLLIIFGGHWLSGLIGLEQWAIQNNFIGMVVLFAYYLIIYIAIDKALHRGFNL